MECEETNGAEQMNEQVYFCFLFNDHEMRGKHWLTTAPDRACAFSLSRIARLDLRGDLR